MRKWLALAMAVIVFAAIHEGTHAAIAALFDEYESFHVRPYGLEVTFKTPVAERSGAHWALISGGSNLVTLLMGYGLLLLGPKFARLSNLFVKGGVYFLTVLTLLLDAFNLSIGPFLYGGDANGIAVGLGINRYLLQGVFFGVLLVNRELVAQKLLPMYQVETTHPLFRPWIRLPNRGHGNA